MRFLRRSGATTDDSPDGLADEVEPSSESHTRGYTPSKGRATPKRREAEGKRRGPVAPPPRTMREAMKRNKELKKTNPNYKTERRAQAKERQRLMAEGDERYLMPRDKGLALVFADLRGLRVVDPEVVDMVTGFMGMDNPYVERNAFLVAESSALLQIQSERMIKQTGASSRRAFRHRNEAEAWMAEVLTPVERARMRLFLDEE